MLQQFQITLYSIESHKHKLVICCFYFWTSLYLSSWEQVAKLMCTFCLYHDFVCKPCSWPPKDFFSFHTMTQWYEIIYEVPHIYLTRNFEMQVINALTSLCLLWVWLLEIKKSEFSHGLSFLKWAVDPSDFMNYAHIFSWKFTQNAEIFADFIKECIFLDVWILVQFWK